MYDHVGTRTKTIVAKGQFVVAIQIMQLSCPLITNFEVTINAYYLSDCTDFNEILKSELQYQKSKVHVCTATYARSGHCLSSDGVWGPCVPACSTILAAGLI